MDQRSLQEISGKIFVIRGQKVMLDADLAALYCVKTGALNRAVHRNQIRFPPDFMFRLDENEWDALRCQNGISKLSHTRGGRRYIPMAFTEQGVAMLSGVLKSEKAALVNIEIMRAFVRIRAIVLTNQNLARQLAALENKYDSQFKVVFDAIRAMMTTPEPSRRRIGIISEDT